MTLISITVSVIPGPVTATPTGILVPYPIGHIVPGEAATRVGITTSFVVGGEPEGVSL